MGVASYHRCAARCHAARHSRREKARLLGAVLCYRLENWQTDNWPPRSQNDIKWLVPADVEKAEKKKQRRSHIGTEALSA